MPEADELGDFGDNLKQSLIAELVADGLSPEEIRGMGIEGVARELRAEQAAMPPVPDAGIQLFGGGPDAGIQSFGEAGQAPFPAGSAMQSIGQGEQAAAAMPPPMGVEQVGMEGIPPDTFTGPPMPEGIPADGLPPNLGVTESIPDIPLDSPDQEAYAQESGRIEGEFGARVRDANRDVGGALTEAAMGAPASADMHQDALELMDGTHPLAEARDDAKLDLQEARDALQIAQTSTIQARTRFKQEEAEEQAAAVERQERDNQQAQVKSQESVARIEQEWAEFRAMKVDPDRALNNMGTGQKITFVLLSVASGVFQAAMVGAGTQQKGPSGTDVIIARIQNIIDNDIRAQEKDIDTKARSVGQAFKLDGVINRNITSQGARLAAGNAMRWKLVKDKATAELAKIDEPAKISELAAVRAQAEMLEAEGMRKTQMDEGQSLYRLAQERGSQVSAANSILARESSERRWAVDRSDRRDQMKIGAEANRLQRAENQRRYDVSEGRKDVAADLSQKREGRYTEQADNKRRSKYFEKVQPVMEGLAQSNKMLDFFTGPNAPNLAEIKLHSINWAPTGLSTEDSQRLKEWKQYMIRYIKDMTGLASPGKERADIMSSLQRTFDSSEDLAQQIRATNEWAQNKVKALDIEFQDVKEGTRDDAKALYNLDRDAQEVKPKESDEDGFRRRTKPYGGAIQYKNKRKKAGSKGPDTSDYPPLRGR